MKKYYLFTMSVAFLLGAVGVVLWLIFNVKAGAVLVMAALIAGAIASIMRPSNHRMGFMDFIRKRKDQ